MTENEFREVNSSFGLYTRKMYGGSAFGIVKNLYDKEQYITQYDNKLVILFTVKYKNGDFVKTAEVKCIETHKINKEDYFKHLASLNEELKKCNIEKKLKIMKEDF